jgi:hypothetical protein
MRVVAVFKRIVILKCFGKVQFPCTYQERMKLGSVVSEEPGRLVEQLAYLGDLHKDQ